MAVGTRVMSKTEDFFDIWNDEQVFGAQELSMAYGDYVQVLFDSNFLKKIQSREKKEFIFLKQDTKIICETLAKLSALYKITKDFTSWLEFGYFTTEHTQMIRKETKRLLVVLKKYAIAITDNFYPPDELMDCMIAPNDGDLYKSIKQRVYSAPGAFQRISNWKELV